MAKLFGKLVGAAVAAAGVYAVGKYLKDYTNYKAADGEDLDALKNGGEKAKEAVRRTYIAIRNKEDVTEPAGELGKAVADVAEGAGRLFSSVGANTVSFARSEKEKYAADPAAYRAMVGENLKDMGKQAAGTFNELKENAETAFQDVREAAEGVMNEVKATAGGFKDDPEDFVEPEAEEAAPATADFSETEEEDFSEIKEAESAQTKVYASLRNNAGKESTEKDSTYNEVRVPEELSKEVTGIAVSVDADSAAAEPEIKISEKENSEKENHLKKDPERKAAVRKVTSAASAEPVKTREKAKENKEVSGWAEERISDSGFEISEDTQDLE